MSQPYLSIDIETTGLDAPRHQILEVAVIVDDLDGDLDDSAIFHRHIIPEDGQYHGDPYALALNQRILIEHHQKDPKYQFCGRKEFAAELKSWLTEMCLDDQRMSIAGKNFAGFDSFFLRVHTLFFQTLKPFHRVIDIGNLFYQPEIDGTEIPDTATCIERAKLPEYLAGDGHHPYITHRASDDAMMVCKMYRAWLKQREEVLERIGECDATA